jgi:hypothetical protein
MCTDADLECSARLIMRIASGSNFLNEPGGLNDENRSKISAATKSFTSVAGNQRGSLTRRGESPSPRLSPRRGEGKIAFTPRGGLLPAGGDSPFRYLRDNDLWRGDRNAEGNFTCRSPTWADPQASRENLHQSESARFPGLPRKAKRLQGESSGVIDHRGPSTPRKDAPVLSRIMCILLNLPIVGGCLGMPGPR